MPSGMEEIESEHASRNPMSSKMRAYQMDIIREEIFGVVSPIMRIGSYEQALELANDSDYGLSAFLFTRDMRRIQRAVLELEFSEATGMPLAMGETRPLVVANHRAVASDEPGTGVVFKWGLLERFEIP